MTSFLVKSGAALSLLLAMQGASANEYQALIKAKKYVEAEKAASAKLAQEPSNAEALVGKAQAILSSSNDARVEEAIKLAEQCVAAHPTLGMCQLVNGKAYGTKAMSGGMMAAMGSAGKIRDAFKKAVELDPRSMDARFSLLQFYTMAPKMMGGGADKAEGLMTQTSAMNPEAGKLMVAMVELAAGRLAKAEAAVLAARPGADEELQDRQASLLVSVGATHMNDKKYAEAERVLRDALKRFPDDEAAAYMVARLLQEQGKHREAIAAMEALAAKIPRAHMHYRIGKSQQALGDKAKAAAAFEKALGFKPALSKKLRADAEEQLKAVKV